MSICCPHPVVDDLKTMQPALSQPLLHAGLSSVDLDPLDVLTRVKHPGCGGLVLFSGEVRDHNQGQRVLRLEYEAYESMARRVIGEILAEAAERWPLRTAACVHRTGGLEPGQGAVLVAVAAPHRKEAYEANQYIISRVKHEAPIWKKEVYEDGSYAWGHNCGH